MNILTSVFKQTTYQIIGKLVTSFSTFIILGIVARNYKEEGTGLFTLALTYITMFYLLSDFGFNAHVLKKMATKGSFVFEWNKLLGTRIIWAGILVVLAILLLPFWSFAPLGFSQAVVFGSFSIIGSALFISCNLIFQYKLRYDLSVWASSLGTMIGLFFYLWFASQNSPVYILLVAQSIGFILIGLLSMLFVRRFIKNIFPIFDFEYIKKLFKDSWPIAATLALNVIYFRVDSFLIAYFKGISDVGVYNVAYSIFQSALVLPTFIMNAYYPIMLKTLSKTKLVGVSLITLALVGTLFTFILSPFLIDLLTGGGGFRGSVSSLRILSLSFPAFFISALFMWYLVRQGEYKKMFLIYFLGLILNIILNFVFIPKYSYLGAAWVTVICEYIILMMQTFVLRGILSK